ncbi:MAG: hypothetical protein HZY75_00165 [Nocardioidaceae bacterium]|nr:MAG: hypothetical protein HZY75_00165 [Nocardioidaceae bacterium]
MRTTVDLSDELVRAAKIRAAERGETLKVLFERALRAEVGVEVTRRRHSFPLVRPARAGELVDPSQSDIEEALYGDDDRKAAGFA